MRILRNDTTLKESLAVLNGTLLGLFLLFCDRWRHCAQAALPLSSKEYSDQVADVHIFIC